MSKYFGTDGFRGRAGVTLTAGPAFCIGQFLAHHYRAGRKGGARVRAVIGKDTRRSCYMLEYAMAAGLTAAGADAYMLHVTTTPSVSYLTLSEHFDVGIMISASHNPFEDNGIKLINGRGEKMDDGTIDRIEEYLDAVAAGKAAPIPQAVGGEIGQIVDFAAGRSRYVGYLTSLATRSYRGLRVALDCANGSAWSIARAVFEALGADVSAVGIEPDGLNINRGVGSTHTEHLSAHVRAVGADVGFAFDGDADRCIAVDGEGEVVNGDHILYILARRMAKDGLLTGNTVVTTVMSNLGLYRALEAAGIGYTQTDVGDRFISERMRQTGYALGGEQSGHVIVGKYASTGDGILTAILLTEAILESGRSIRQLAAPMRMYPQLTRNLTVTDRDAVMADPVIRQRLEALSEELAEGGRILLRKSGTEPLIRIMVEAAQTARCEACADEMEKTIRERGL